MVHGQLSARKVLLADENTVKITDIGISREAFEKKSSRLWNWMAIESLQDRVFSSQSDVWSFAITMWELFSLGQEPYSGNSSFRASIVYYYTNSHLNVGIRDRTALTELLQSEKRLERPVYAPNAIADLMGNCWISEPKERPTFGNLEHVLGKISRQEVDCAATEKNKPDKQSFGSVQSPPGDGDGNELKGEETCIEIPSF